MIAGAESDLLGPAALDLLAALHLPTLVACHANVRLLRYRAGMIPGYVETLSHLHQSEEASLRSHIGPISQNTEPSVPVVSLCADHTLA